MIARDPLWAVELVTLFEEASSDLRHDVRNRIAAIRNMAFFVRRRLAGEPNPERDPRVALFLEKIEGEVQTTDETIDGWSARIQGVHPSQVSATPIVECVSLAVAAARLTGSIQIELSSLSGTVRADREQLALAVRCLIENAGEALGAGVVTVTAQSVGNDCQILVVDRGPGLAEPARALKRFETTKPGHLGLGLCMAQRIATRFGGSLRFGAPAVGSEVSLCLPLVDAGSKPEGS